MVGGINMIKCKKLLAVLVCMAMVLSFVPVVSFASEGEASVQAGSYRDWKQNEGPWADYIMGSGSAKVSTYGCTIVSLAMIAVPLGCGLPLWRHTILIHTPCGSKNVLIPY